MQLVSGSPAHQKAVAEAGAILPLVMLLSWASGGAKEQAAAALSKLCEGTAKPNPNRDAVISAQAIPALVAMLSAADEKGSEEKGSKPGVCLALRVGGREWGVATCVQQRCDTPEVGCSACAPAAQPDHSASHCNPHANLTIPQITAIRTPT
jgi:hypothetical protein